MCDCDYKVCQLNKTQTCVLPTNTTECDVVFDACCEICIPIISITILIAIIILGLLIYKNRNRCHPFGYRKHITI